MAKKKIFRDPLYEAILERAEAFFPNCVTVDTISNQIIIKDSVIIVIHCSMNETKVLINTFVNIIGEDIDFFMKLIDLNPSFRLFTIDDVIKYLNVKANENNLIKSIEK